MLGWILALMGDGLGRMEPSCPAAGPVRAPGRLQRAVGAGAPPGCPLPHGTGRDGDTRAPGTTRSWCKRGGPSAANRVPALRLVAVLLWGVQRDRGVPAERGWCCTEGVLSRRILRSSTAFHPRFE